MAYMADADRTVFQEAVNTVLDNFTNEELLAIRDLAAQLRTILNNAKEREQRRLK